MGSEQEWQTNAKTGPIFTSVSSDISCSNLQKLQVRNLAFGLLLSLVDTARRFVTPGRRLPLKLSRLFFREVAKSGRGMGQRLKEMRPGRNVLDLHGELLGFPKNHDVPPYS